MRMRMSKGFRERWHREGMAGALASVVLAPRLRALIEAPLVREAEALVLEPLATPTVDPATFQDRTGYEAFVNKIHVEDLIDDEGAAGGENLGESFRQGIKAARLLSERLQTEGRYRVLLSLDHDPPTLTLRFFELRDGEPWGSEDPDGYPLEELLMIDTAFPDHE